MRSILLFFVFVMVASVAFGQPGNFKLKNKKQSGTVHPSISFQQVNGNTNLKSATVSPFKSLNGLVKPNLQNKGTMVRKM
ncbi:MAG TPA: hypothetical protein PLB87_11180, partial [Prolixibacteraceae bacterium]|nr:hypothetical protein [Prolixibacteraceae bacterium]